MSTADLLESLRRNDWSDVLPISCILTEASIPEQDYENNKKNLLFCVRFVLKALQHFIEGNYDQFDSHTSAKCCHGVSLLAQQLLRAGKLTDAYHLYREGEKYRILLEGSQALEFIWRVPHWLIELAILHLLYFCSEPDYSIGRRVEIGHLSAEFSVSNKFSKKIVRRLQKRLSNAIASSYSILLAEISDSICVADMSIQAWGKYVQPEYCRQDISGRTYVSSLYSLQVTLGCLISSGSVFAMVCDHVDYKDSYLGRQVQCFWSDGREFHRVAMSHLHKLGRSPREPIVVFGGVSRKTEQEYHRSPAISDVKAIGFDSLILACDCHYPEFPRVGDDPQFDSKPIEPAEKEMRCVLERHSAIQGVTAQDPSLFCLTHVYPASLEQVLKVGQGKDHNALPRHALTKAAQSPNGIPQDGMHKCA